MQEATVTHFYKFSNTLAFHCT